MKEMIYYQCPFCGWCRPVKYGGREVRFDKVEPRETKPFQIRQLSGGRIGEPKGGHIEITESKSLKELSNEMKNQIQNQCEKILDSLK